MGAAMMIKFELFLCAALSFLSIAFALWRQKHPGPATTHHIARATLVVYALAVMTVTFFPIHLRLSVSSHIRSRLIPLEDIAYIYEKDGGINRIDFWKNFADNVFLFMPLGVLVPLVRHVTFRYMVVLGISASMLIEGVQLIIQLLFPGGRLVSTDDILLSTFGTIVGYLLFEANAKKWWARQQKYDQRRAG
jgi:glycopeptide antibiotics resistance protein